MPLSWNEIRERSVAFSREWINETSEDAEAKSFWDSFFNVFGISRRRVATFETPVKKGDGSGGFIDLLWKGTLLVEHKSRGKNLDRAFKQAIDYFPGLKERDLPKYVLVSDFARFRLYNLDTGKTHDFPLKELYKHIRLFGFVAGYQTHSFGKEDPVNIKAAEQLGKLHDQLKNVGYDGHQLELYLVRLLFCLFAEDTSIFEKGTFQEFIEQRSNPDGSDLGGHLAHLFQILDTPLSRRSTVLDDQMAAFQYINGKLFAEMLPLASFNSNMRETLLDCCALDWSRISPAIFGSLFQSIMDPQSRREAGAHYTREANILKALRPLFLDELKGEFQRVRLDPKRLAKFQKKLASIRILDPACGCGNFLVIAYRELRFLEIEVLRELYKTKESGFLDVGSIVNVDVDQFYGIEIGEFPAHIAQVALWLTDHQMNMMVSEEFGQYFVRLPLSKAPNIVHGNSLSLNWNEVFPLDTVGDIIHPSYIVGNPPFVGAKKLTPEQREDVYRIFHNTNGAGVLDYVACWYRKAADFMAAHAEMGFPRTAFVSTNSITQGEQVGVLWQDLFRLGVSIHFAHRTFQWTSEARGKAAVHCIIVGFGPCDVNEKWLFDYDTPKSEPHSIRAGNINPYLVDAPDILLSKRSKPISDAPAIVTGNKPIDNGAYLFEPDEKAKFLALEPRSEPFFRRWMGADEFINGYERWCLWLGDCNPEELRRMPEAMKRVDAVKAFRLASISAPTRKLAATPTRFHVENMPDAGYLVVPQVSSENRSFIPIGFMSPETLVSNLVCLIPNATIYHFGVLSSTMHNAWMRAVCGRMKSSYRYSAGIVYNNFAWPAPTEKHQNAIETAAQAVLTARDHFPNATLADLYDPSAMPPELVKAHQALDRAVDSAYGARGMDSEAKRVAFLFDRYQSIISPAG